MTFNALGIKIKGTEQTLAAKLGIELPEADKAKELTAEVKDTENLVEVVVEFSNADLVDNKDALLNPANYTFNDSDIKVQHVEQDGDKVVLHLTPFGKLNSEDKATPLRKGKKYDLTIRNIDKAINTKYKGILANDNILPSVEKVEFIGTHGIKVTTNEPIADLQERNFRLDARTSMIVEQYGREIILTPYHKKEFAKDKVELTIYELEDFAGYKSIKTLETMTVSEDEALPKVTAAYRKGNVVVVEFDRDVYLDSIEARSNRLNLGNISFRESRVDVYAKDAKKVDTNVVEYTFEREVPKGAEVVIEGVANHFNKAMEKETRVVSEFKDNHMPYVISHTEKLTISEKTDKDLVAKAKSNLPANHKDEDVNKEIARLLDKGYQVNTVETANKDGKMTITFDKDLEIFKNEKNAVAYLNGKDAGKTSPRIYDYITVYELDVTNRGKSAAADVKILVEDVKKDAIVLSFDKINLNNKDRDYDYVLEVRNFRDLTGNRMDVAYLDFRVNRYSDAFNVTSIKVSNKKEYFNRDGIEIVLKFNSYVNKEEASNERNYYLDGKLDVDEAIVERDGTTVALLVYDYESKAKFLSDYKLLEISPRVTNLNSTTTVANRFWDLKLEEEANDPSVKPEVTNITYINTADNKEAKNELALDVTTNINTISVKLTGEVGDKAQILVLDKDGRIVSGSVQDHTLVAATETHAITLSHALAIGEKFTIVTKMGTEEARLVVKAVDTSVATKLTYDINGAIEIPVAADVASLILPYGVDKDDVNVSKFTVKGATVVNGVTLEKIVSVTKTSDIIFITVEAENGDRDVHKVTLVNGTASTSNEVLTAAGKVVTLDVTDNNGVSTDKTVKGLKANDFKVTTDGTVVTNVLSVVESPAGSYTLTVEDNLAAGATVTLN